jgi:hypothetical protein
VMDKGVVSMGPELGGLLDALEFGLALSGAVGNEVGMSRGADDSVRDTLACWIVGGLVLFGVEVCR